MAHYGRIFVIINFFKILKETIWIFSGHSVLRTEPEKSMLLYASVRYNGIHIDINANKLK